MQKSRVYLHFCRRETQRKLAFTVHHTGSTKNIQDLRNFAHFAQKVSTRKYKKKPALDGERVYFKTCAQQASNSRRRGVQNSVHKSYTKSTENLSIFLHKHKASQTTIDDKFDAQTGNCRQKISVQTLDTCRRNLYP